MYDLSWFDVNVSKVEMFAVKPVSSSIGRADSVAARQETTTRKEIANGAIVTYG